MSVCWLCIREKSRRESSKTRRTVVHPDTLTRDMANIDVDWEVEGIITPEESVTKMLKVFTEKGKDDSGTFWCWDGRVRELCFVHVSHRLTMSARLILGEARGRSL